MCDLFGSDSDTDFTPITSSTVSSPAYSLSSSLVDGGRRVSTGLSRSGTFPQGAFDQRFPRILSNIDTLRESIRPGFSQLREARLRQVSNARSRGLSDLRDNLRRRRVSGASFANDQIIRAEREFGELAAEQEAKSFLEELGASQQILNLESAQIFEALERELAELNLASGFATNAADLFSRNQMFATQIAISEAQARGEFFGDIAGTILGLGLGVATAPSGSFINPATAAAVAGGAQGGSVPFGGFGGGGSSPIFGGGSLGGQGSFSILR